jgi:ParB family chromosome partitioning protein
MGRGLSALLAPAHDNGAARASELREIPVELIAPNPRQPRRDFDEGALVQLADSLRERGVLQPVLLRPVPGGTYELIAGERRWRAAQLADFETVPALVRPHDDAESLELALIENMAREDLNPVEEARACALLVDELGLTREDVGRRVGRSRVAVSNLMRLLDLPDEVLELLAAGHLTEGHGRALLTASDHDARRTLARAAVQEGWSVRQTEARARDTGRRAAPRRAAAEPADTAHPDQVEAARRLGDALGRALGTEVKVAPRGDGYRVVVELADPGAAEALAERLGAVEPA